MNFIQYEFVNYAPSLFDNFSLLGTVKTSLAQSINLDEYVIKEYEPPPAIFLLWSPSYGGLSHPSNKSTTH